MATSVCTGLPRHVVQNKRNAVGKQKEDAELNKSDSHLEFVLIVHRCSFMLPH